MVVGLLVAASAACGGPSTSNNAPEPPPPVDPGTPPNVTVVENPVDFGLADCGGTAPDAKVVKITNSGGGTVAWTAELESTGFNIVGATSGTFSGGGSVNVKVRASAIPASATAGAVSLATLVIVIDKSKIFRVPLRIGAQGATLTVQPTEAAFGDWPINTQAPDQAITIKNTGNKEATVAFKQPALTDFGLTWTGSPATVKVAPGASVAGAMARFRPSKLTLQSTNAPMTVTGAVCGASATTVPMNGKGTGGVVGISPGQLDFGKVSCGGKGGFQVFTILNSGNSPFTWTGSLGLGAGSSFDISPVSGTVLAGSQTNVFVTPKDIPATSAVTDNLYGDTLTVTTNAAGDTPHPITLLMTAKGAILAYTAVPNDYGVRGLFTAPLSKAVSVSNTGNAPANVKLTVSSAAYAVTPVGVTPVAAAGTLNASVGFVPTAFGTNNADLSMITADVLCQPLPPSSPLTGSGKGIASNVGVGSVGRNGDGGASACAVISGGHVACWGDNRYGQLGIGSTLPANSPTPVVIPNFANAVAVAGAGEYNCARTTTGTVYCWGRNGNNNRTTGQLGTAGSDKSTPTLVQGLTNVISLAAAERHTCAVSTVAAGGTSGKVYCWGQNRHGNLGTGTLSESSAPPLQVAGITDAISVTVAGFGGCARRVGNVVSCWGEQNYHGNLGNGTTAANTNGPPVTVTGVSTAAAVASGGYGARSGISCVALTGGTVQCWGDNRAPNRFGGGTIGKITGVAGTASDSVSTPVTIPSVTGATAIATGQRHMCAIVGATGTGLCWGVGANGELGNGATPNVSPPVVVTGLTGATQISASGESTCALLGTGSITCWGSNSSGQLGNAAAGGPTPTVVSGF
jgi:alpha-tubulin suppressor-like RCC1 family protein